MIWMESPSKDPYFNLAMEEYVFSCMDKTEQYLMLWQNSNTIVVGKYQNTAEEVNQEFVDSHGIRVARRMSGGGAVYHDNGNLNYTFIIDQKDLEDFNFQALVKPVLHVLEGFGVHAEFNGRNDLVIDGKKFSGSSQYAKDGRLMHHGCIMLDSNLAAVASALRVRQAKIESKGVKSVISHVTTINENAPRPVTMEEFKAAIVREVASGNGSRKYELTEEDKAEIEKLREEKYATWDWNYGFSGNYGMQNEKKFPAGMVSVAMNVKNGRIEDIRLFGDFFGNGELSELEKAMVGLPLDSALVEELKKLNVSYYMNGISPEELCQLLMY